MYQHETEVRIERLTHNVVLAYLFWLLGFLGAHRFYLGRQLSGLIYFLTLGLLGIGWLVDAFFLPRMCRETSNFYLSGKYDYNVAWLLFAFLGVFGIHRFYLGKWITGVLYFCTGGFVGLGLLYDLFFLNEEVNERNRATCNFSPSMIPHYG